MANIKEKEKEVAISIVDMLAREGCSVFPGGGLAYDSIKALVKYGKKYYEDRNNKRLEEFHIDLLTSNNGKPETVENLSKECSADDYYSILKSLLQDEENNKTHFYSSLMKVIIHGNLNQDHKKYFIRTLRKLSYFDLDLIRLLYIYSNFELKGNGSIKDQLKEFGNNIPPIAEASLSNLIRLGYIKFIHGLHLPTPLLEELAQIIFNNDELSPKSIGREAIYNVDIFVATFVDDDSLSNDDSVFGIIRRDENDKRKYRKILSYINQALELTGKSFMISNPERFTQAQKSASLIILCLDKNETQCSPTV
jgi:hypothetical protein